VNVAALRPLATVTERRGSTVVDRVLGLAGTTTNGRKPLATSSLFPATSGAIAAAIRQPSWLISFPFAGVPICEWLDRIGGRRALAAMPSMPLPSGVTKGD
jgi:hypothetical protein